MANRLRFGDLVSRFAVAPHVLRYAIKTYGPEPVDRCGGYHLWATSDLPKIEAALRKTAARKSARKSVLRAGEPS